MIKDYFYSLSPSQNQNLSVLCMVVNGSLATFRGKHPNYLVGKHSLHPNYLVGKHSLHLLQLSTFLGLVIGFRYGAARIVSLLMNPLACDLPGLVGHMWQTEESEGHTGHVQTIYYACILLTCTSSQLWEACCGEKAGSLHTL